ncbi:acyl-CoA dehydrogenase [Actinoplanes sp. SE50]|uniref:acyl-CoA dehydrogenase family protein n=1 Tax=unclassified Actinoplanes TaxID=2626549 RepID=UPI00023ECBAE|nr:MULTISPECIES: acyl-CoA dehydrogenase family protein [unclassified Actinoplanes]AEV87126.1 acyl-CoA dehydrogenase [Actinoplanes sp. SE50/110]ATO85524.1 acyl-CoA dehydrogenase [Actinoplanes sp. SE50]SLM02937.1 acyl-CoA dehydrogenase [Actinoplanes sp. SE50/110]
MEHTLRSDVRQRAEAVLPTLAAHATRIDAEALFPVESLDCLRSSGLMGLLVPVEHGGLGGGIPDLIEVAGLLASRCLSTAMIWAMHCQQVDAVVQFAGPQLRAELLPRIAGGEVYLGSITSERTKGGHLFTSASPLEPAGDDFLLDRDAPIVTGGAYADGFLTTMLAAPDAPPTEVTLVYADRSQMAIDQRGTWNPLGMRGTHSVGLHLRGQVPGTQVVGEPGGFRHVAANSLVPLAHLGWSACWLGTAKGALRELLALRAPHRPRGLDPKSELVAARVARVRMELEVVSTYLTRVCQEVMERRANSRDLDEPATQIHLNTLKVIASESCFRAIDGIVEIAGLAQGYRRDAAVPFERYFRDLRSASLNYANDRLLVATGVLSMLDRSVRLSGEQT